MKFSRTQLLELADRLAENKEEGQTWTDEQIVDFFIADHVSFKKRIKAAKEISRSHRGY